MGQSNSLLCPDGQWDAMYCSEEKCELALREEGEGSFLLRRNVHDANMKLLVFINGQIFTFEVSPLKSGGYHCCGEISRSLGSLMKKFMSNGLPGQSGRIPLKNPVGLPIVWKHSHYMDVFEMPLWYRNDIGLEEACTNVMKRHPGYFMVIPDTTPHSYKIVANDAGRRPSVYTVIEQSEFKVKFGKIVFSSIDKAISTLAKKGLASGVEGTLKLLPKPPIAYENATATLITTAYPLESATNVGTTNEWYAGPVGKEAAEKYILSPKCDHGSYMFHSNPDVPTSFYISANCENRLAIFKIVFKDQCYHFGPNTFTTLLELHSTVLKKGLVSRGFNLKLVRPVANEFLGKSESSLTKNGTLKRLKKLIPGKKTVAPESLTQPPKLASYGSPSSTISPPVFSQEQQSIQTVKPVQPQLPPRLPLPELPPELPGKRMDASTTSSQSSRHVFSMDSSESHGKEISLPLTPTRISSQKMGGGLKRKPSYMRDPKEVVLELGLSMPVTPMDVGEFKLVPRKNISPEDLPQHGVGPRLNRFRDILPNPATRVMLSQIPEDPTLEYINANYIRGYGHCSAREYIAAQAPMRTGVFNFWRMLWETKVHTIIMTTQFIESNKSKCAEYFSEDPSASVLPNFVFGPESLLFHVQTLTKQVKPEYEIRVIRVTVHGESRDITHFWHTSWPDHDVPKLPSGEMNTTGSLNILHEVRQHRRKVGDTNPLLIHCSAGIGRTGTLIVIDHAMRGIENGDVIDINKIIAELREDRMALVQHVNQYKFCYQAVVEYARQWAERSHSSSMHGLQPAIYGSTDPIYAVTSSKKDEDRMRRNPKWRVHSESHGQVVFSLQSTLIPEDDDDNIAVFKPSDDDTELERITEEEEEAMLEEEARDITSRWWFRSNFTRGQVDELLLGLPSGSFLVRNSSRPGCFAMSVQDGSKIVNMLISPVEVGGITKYKLGNNKNLTAKDIFDDLDSLVANCLKLGVKMSQQDNKLIRLRGREDDADDDAEA
eukprot:m.114810 g.114810  ORF g.114810 m.114810 type:complete len:1000 (+) comp9283_c5_seq1:123-3122(+)